MLISSFAGGVCPVWREKAEFCGKFGVFPRCNVCRGECKLPVNYSKLQEIYTLKITSALPGPTAALQARRASNQFRMPSAGAKRTKPPARGKRTLAAEIKPRCKLVDLAAAVERVNSINDSGNDSRGTSSAGASARRTAEKAERVPHQCALGATFILYAGVYGFDEEGHLVLPADLVHHTAFQLEEMICSNSANIASGLKHWMAPATIIDERKGLRINCVKKLMFFHPTKQQSYIKAKGARV